MTDDNTFQPDLSLYKSEKGFKKMMSWYEKVCSEITVDYNSIFVAVSYTHLTLPTIYSV